MENQMDGACSMHVTEGNECIAVAWNHVRRLDVEYPEETERTVVDWTDLAQVKYQWRTHVNTVMNFRVQ
jgi:hypothetical protein